MIRFQSPRSQCEIAQRDIVYSWSTVIVSSTIHVRCMRCRLSVQCSGRKHEKRCRAGQVIVLLCSSGCFRLCIAGCLSITTCLFRHLGVSTIQCGPMEVSRCSRSRGRLIGGRRRTQSGGHKRRQKGRWCEWPRPRQLCRRLENRLLLVSLQHSFRRTGTREPLEGYG
jgi:hypothetical protein